jgi:hypothetical protein
MAFIDSSYFVGEINILNAWNEATLSQAIDQYEKEILIQLLGYKLYALLIADCTGGIPATQKYLDLVNGKEFILDHYGEEITLKWEGLKNSTKQSLIAYYVFYKSLERDVTRLYGTGVSISSSGNGWERVSPVNKLCNAWERMRELYGKIQPEFKKYYPHQLKGTSLHVFNADPSAYNFLLTNVTDYPDWIFTPQWNINTFGI